MPPTCWQARRRCELGAFGKLRKVSVPLSVLDLAPIGSGQTAAEALAGSTRVARRADELGYRRYWVAEHHNIPSVASTSPEVLLAHLGAHTERIRLGSGGVMLPNHAPLAVAERFAMLEALHPGRIDLGLGRAPGTDMRTALALRSTSPHEFESQLAELRGYLGSGHAGMRAISGDHTHPQIWMLGSTDGGARIAAALGMPFTFAHHFHPQFTEPAVELYRSLFEPSDELAQPRVMVAAAVIAGDDDEHARRLALTAGVSMLRLRQGRPMPIPTIEEAEALLPRLSPEERTVVDEVAGRQIAGGSSAVHSGLLDLIERVRPDELMITSNVPDADVRAAGLERVADVFGLVPAAA